MTPFSNEADRARVAALDAEVRRLDGALIDIATRADEARARRAALSERLAGQRASARAEDPATDALAAQLATDPSADIADAAVKRLRQSRAATADQADTLTAIEAAVAKAMATIDAELAAIDAERTATDAARLEAWVTFVRVAHDLLVDEFRARWASLLADVVGPMLALGEQRVRRDTSELIVTGHSPRLTSDSSLVLKLPVGQEYLLTGDNTGGPRRRFADTLPALLATIRE